MRVAIHVKREHAPWAKAERAREDINPPELYDYYWTSNARELELQSGS